MDWFRSHHGAPSDPKWQLIARKAQVPTCAVVSLFWMLLDHASQHSSRGSVEGFDAEVAAMYLGLEDDQVEAILQALTDKSIIQNDRLANWEKRQPKREREDDSTERVREYRARSRQQTETQETSEVEPQTIVTPRNATVTPCNAMERPDKIREDKIFSPLPPKETEAPQETMATETKAFSLSDTLPYRVQEVLDAQCPPWYEAHLRLALVGRSPRGLASYAMEILRGWLAGKNAPTGPLPAHPSQPASGEYFDPNEAERKRRMALARSRGTFPTRTLETVAPGERPRPN